MAVRPGWHDYFKNHCCTNFNINDVPRIVSFTFSGIPYWTFQTDSEKPSLAALIDILLHCSKFSQSFMHQDRPPLLSKFLIFRFGTEINFTRAMWDNSVPKWPLKVKYYEGKIFTSFKTNYVTLASEADELPLLTYQEGRVWIDPVTRKPFKSLPEDIMTTYNGLNAVSTGLRIERLKQRPVNTYMRKWLLVLSDVGRYNHVNYKVYQRRCYENLIEAISEKEYLRKTDKSGITEQSREKVSDSPGCTLPKYLTWEAMQQNIKTLRCRYVKECSLGEEICFHLWQEEEKPLWVFFTAEREKPDENEIVFEMSLEFFSVPSNL